jgi:bifunctional UDP-N-acetylglucosamine pyrophosphorylase/glucosamine-1-phosphate N-acetyltransferase
VTLVTSSASDPTGYGRIFRDPLSGAFHSIVEEADLTPVQREIKEFNAGLYIYQAAWLWPALRQINPSPKGEYYLTDLAQLAANTPANPAPVETVFMDMDEIRGINDRAQLAEADALLRQRIIAQHHRNGVTINDPASVYISAETEIGPDSVIAPNTHLRGRCQVGSNCIIGPNSVLENAAVADNCQIVASFIESSTLEHGVRVGPFSHIRSGCYVEHDVHLGNFAEINRSHLGAYTRQGHFSYIGDSEVGVDVNIGAGTVTANYDGKHKNKTTIGAHAFIGSDTIIRAPLTIGENAATGAGSVVTHDVEAGSTVVGVPAREIKKA